MKDKSIIFAADGLLGLSHLGAMHYLNSVDTNFMKKFDNYIGASIGSIWCFLFSMNIPLERIIFIGYNIFQEDFTECFEDMSFKSLNKYFGLTKCNFKTLNDLLVSIFNRESVTFELHYKKFNKNLVISGFNLTTSKIEYFNHMNTPDMKIIDAIRISTCIPIMFSPINLNSYKYMDPVLSENIPISYLKTVGIKATKHNTIVVNKVNKFNSDVLESPRTIFGYILYLITRVCNIKQGGNSELLDYNAIYLNIDIPGTHEHDVSLLMHFTNNDMYDLLKYGYKAAKLLNTK